MNRFSLYSIVFVGILLSLTSCNKEDDALSISSDASSIQCDIHDYTGQWTFVLNNDPTTEFIGHIDKFNDTTINLFYQPDTEYNYFLQVDVNCEDELIVYKSLPAGNHGTTIIEGTITTTHFEYTRTKTINYTGTPQVTVTHIEGNR